MGLREGGAFGLNEARQERGENVGRLPVMAQREGSSRVHETLNTWMKL